jgi:iduronate 2-sulfatase
MLDELSSLQLAERTLVALVGDHGWQLGELDLWRKMSNFELAVRVPLLMRVPWRPASLGRR